MKVSKLSDFIKGWFVGSFAPTLVDTTAVEVAVKRYKAGDAEGKHHHKIAYEITVIVSGEVEMNGIHYKEDDIIVIAPGESTDFKCITDAVTTVVKFPGAKNDKYIDE